MRNAEVPSVSCWSHALWYLSDQGVLPSPHYFRLDQRWGLTQELTHPVLSKVSSSYGKWWPRQLGQYPWFSKTTLGLHKKSTCQALATETRAPWIAWLSYKGEVRDKDLVSNVYPQFSCSSECYWGLRLTQRWAPLFSAGLCCATFDCVGRLPLKAPAFIVSVSFKLCFAYALHC